MTTTTPSNDAEWADREEAEQTAILNQFTQSLEESTFLRRLARHFELRDVRHSLSEVAAEVLPDLRQIVLARTIGLIPGDFLSEEGRFPPVWAGHPLREDAIRCLLKRCAVMSVDHPAVMNESALAATPLAGYGFRSLILARVESSNVLVGWLIVMNRDLDELVPSDSPIFATELEFGSVEAGLVQATAAMMATHARNVALFDEKEKLLIGVIAAMSGAVDARDPYTHGHSRRVAVYARIIAKEMGLSPSTCEAIYVSGLLHDIGKIGVPDFVLQKDGALTDEEYEIIKQHPETGYQILRHLEDLSYVLPGVRHHHEREDGRGYPHGLAGEETPLMARILAVADSYDAMTSCRPYRNAMPREKAESILKQHAGEQWDTNVVDAFFRCVEEIRTAGDDYASDPNQSILSTMMAGRTGEATPEANGA